MTTEELAMCWVPVPLRWRHTRPGDVIVGKGDDLWMIEGVSAGGWGDRGFLVQGQTTYETPRGSIDPDETVQVLVPLPEREALTVARDELAARVIERRTAP